MIIVNIDPVLLHLGHFALRWYGLIVVTAASIGIWVALREAKRKGLSEYQFADAIPWVVVGGLIGARLFHVIDHWPDEYAANPLRALYVWEGGLAIWGGVIGGLAALALFAWRRALPLAVLLDTAVPGLVLGQAIGRIACIITGDAVGKLTTGPFGLAYSNPGALVPQLGVYYSPTPIYEILMNLTIFAVVWRLRRRPLPDGALFLVYLVLYSVGRFVITFWSAYKIVALGFNQAQLISLAGLAVGIPALLYLLWRQRPARTVVAG
jgi:phosphatidylglycerol---prolipoprotein diacylglyceryl transferase